MKKVYPSSSSAVRAGEDIPYAIRFVRPGHPWYGIIKRWSKEGRKALKAGYYLIEDAILPIVFERKKDMVTVVSDDEYHKFVENNFKEAIKEAKKHPFVHTLRAGHILGVGVADGTAWYVVTEVKGELCKVSWRGWCPDRWIAPFLGWGGEFRVKDIKPMVWGPEALKLLP